MRLNVFVCVGGFYVFCVDVIVDVLESEYLFFFFEKDFVCVIIWKRKRLVF